VGGEEAALGGAEAPLGGVEVDVVFEPREVSPDDRGAASRVPFVRREEPFEASLSRVPVSWVVGLAAPPVAPPAGCPCFRDKPASTVVVGGLPPQPPHG
jgi:hypothetical protein